MSFFGDGRQDRFVPNQLCFNIFPIQGFLSSACRVPPPLPLFFPSHFPLSLPPTPSPSLSAYLKFVFDQMKV